MGNATSGESAEQDQDLRELQSTPENALTSEDNLFDLSPLYDFDALQKALINLREIPGNAITQNKDSIIKWLKSLIDRDQRTINVVQFIDHVSTKGISRKDAMEFFLDADRDGEGVVDITYFLGILKESGVVELTQTLHSCSILPGALDVYMNNNKDSLVDTGRKLTHFLQHRRAEIDKLTLPSLERILSNFSQREKLVEGRFCAVLEIQKENELMGVEEGGEGRESGKERAIVKKCYSKVIVSTNDKTASNLFDGRSDTYWQSNGSPRKHSIKIVMLKGILVKELAIEVMSSDDSYMPKNVAVLVGNSENKMKEIKNAIIPRELTGKFVLLRNLGVAYQHVMIHFRGCHSDGCDTRVRGLFIKGCRLNREAEVSVLDTMSIWFLQLVASTARAAMPTSPHLRDTIIAQSRLALMSLPPLTLSPTSPSRPEFISSFVTAEMDTFLRQLCVPDDNLDSLCSESLQVLLGFSLAHGNVNSILDCLQILLDNLSMSFTLGGLLTRMGELKLEKRNKHAVFLKMSLIRHDGGEKAEAHKAENMLTNDNEGGSPYVSDTGRKVVNVLLQVSADEAAVMTPTSLMVKVQSGNQGASSGLVFLFNHDGPLPENLFDQFSKYDEWTAEDYDKLKKERESGSAEMDDFSPVAHFVPDKETCDAEVTMDVLKPRKYVLIKFFASLSETADRMGVHYVKVIGHQATPTEVENATFLDKLSVLAPLPVDPSSLVSGETVLLQTLSFLITMLKDLNSVHKRRKAFSFDPYAIAEAHLNVSDLSLEKLWNVYIPLSLKSGDAVQYGSTLCLHLLLSSLPFIQSNPSRHTTTTTSTQGNAPPPTSSDPSLTTPAIILKHLCGQLDNGGLDPVIKRLAQDIVVEGVVVFFADSKTRKDYLLSMISEIQNTDQPPSWWLKFEALCRYFSESDSNFLLGLPKTPSQEDGTDVADVTLSTLGTMITVTKTEALNCIMNCAQKPNDLVKLLCALQSSLFFWSRQHLSEESSEEVKKCTAAILTKYVKKLAEDVSVILTELDKMKDIEELDDLLDALGNSIAGRAFPQAVVHLSTLVNCEVDKIPILKELMPIFRILTSLFEKLPNKFPRVNSDLLKPGNKEEKVVAVWTRESPHNYENNSKINEEFVCFGASHFEIEFDSRCKTERRYDTLEFLDSMGHKQTFDDSVGSTRWPKTARFSGPKVNFQFRSDGSNNDWGYKFILKAYGNAIPSLFWLFDLHLALSKLLGQLCSSVLVKNNTRRTLPLAAAAGGGSGSGSSNKGEKDEDEILMHSDIWKTLFRGGYMVGKLTRSLSGAYSASPADSPLNTVLQDLASGDEEGGALRIVEVCRATHKGPFYGGPLVDRAINAVFAALIWHTQDIREELIPFVSDPSITPVASPGLLSAFKSAEALRRELVEARQRLVETRENKNGSGEDSTAAAAEKKEEQQSEEKEKAVEIDEDAPVKACHDKAVFLLKFSGLSRVPREEEWPPSSPVSSRPTWAKKNKKWSKVSAAVNTVGVLKQRVSS